MILFRSLLAFFCFFFAFNLADAAILWQNGAGNVGVMRLRDGTITSTHDLQWIFPDPEPTPGGGATSTALQLLEDGGQVSATETSTAAEIADAAAGLDPALLVPLLGMVIITAAGIKLLYDPNTDTWQEQEQTCTNGATLSVLAVNFSGGPFSSYGSCMSDVDNRESAAGYPVPSWTGPTLSPNGQYTMNASNGLACTATCNGSPSTSESVPALPQDIQDAIDNWLNNNPSSGPELVKLENANNHPPVVQISNTPEQTVSLPPQVTTQTNPDGSKDTTTTTITDTINPQYPDVNIGRQTTTTTQYTPAPTTSNPNPTPVASGPTKTSSSPMPSGSNPTPQQFVPPDVSVPNVPPVPPGVIQLPIPTIDNSGGTCPPPIVMNVGLPGLQTITMDLTPWCTLAGYLRPLVLTAGALAAMFILVK